MPFLDTCSLDLTYPFAAIRATRISRMSEQEIGDFRLTAEIVQELSQDEIGVLVGNCGDMRRIGEKIEQLGATDYPAVWVVVMNSKQMALTWFNAQAEKYGTPSAKKSTYPRYWRLDNCWYTTMEGLQSLSDSSEFSGPVAGILVIDPYLKAHCFRGEGNEWQHNYDRPELVVRFQVENMKDGVRPPLVFFAVPPAKSLNTTSVASLYGFSTWWYADGRMLRVGKPPVIA